jgi:hypothetical protein
VILFAFLYSCQATNGKGPSVAQASGNPPRGRGRLDNARAKGRTDSARKDPGRLPGIRTISRSLRWQCYRAAWKRLSGGTRPCFDAVLAALCAQETNERVNNKLDDDIRPVLRVVS